jgi:hypothetical protein
VEKYCRAGQATDDNMAHAHDMLDNYGYKYTHRLCNTHCFSTATMVAPKRLNVTLNLLNLKGLVPLRLNVQLFIHRGTDPVSVGRDMT